MKQIRVNIVVILLAVSVLSLFIIQAFQVVQLYERKLIQFNNNLKTSLERIAIRHEKAEDIRRYMRLVNNDFSSQYKDILKQEFNLTKGFNNIEEAKVAVSQAINIYNQIRIHRSNGLITPEAMHAQCIIKIKKWPSKRRKFSARQEEEPGSAAVRPVSSNVQTMTETGTEYLNKVPCL